MPGRRLQPHTGRRENGRAETTAEDGRPAWFFPLCVSCEVRSATPSVRCPRELRGMAAYGMRGRVRSSLWAAPGTADALELMACAVTPQHLGAQAEGSQGASVHMTKRETVYLLRKGLTSLIPHQLFTRCPSPKAVASDSVVIVLTPPHEVPMCNEQIIVGEVHARVTQ